METNKRINISKSVYIGDHVWMGQDCIVLKGTSIGSGSVISAHAVAAGKSIPSNVAFAGNPGKILRENIFFDTQSVHNFTPEKTEASMNYGDQTPNVFNVDRKHTIVREELEEELSSAKNVEKRLKIIKKRLVKNRHHDRLAIE
jgi:carbonic anhydrase/acetyltransferase-like protein (isoleucine patch superfamily)